MTGRDWVEYFEVVFERTPTPEEYAEALRRGEFEREQSNANQMSVDKNEMVAPKLNDVEHLVAKTKEVVVEVADTIVGQSHSMDFDSLTNKVKETVNQVTANIGQQTQFSEATFSYSEQGRATSQSHSVKSSTFWDSLNDKAKGLLIGTLAGILIAVFFGFKDGGTEYYYGESFEVGSLLLPEKYTYTNYFYSYSDEKSIEKELNAHLRKKRFENLPGVLVGSGIMLGCMYVLGQDDEFKRQMAYKMLLDLGMED